MLIRFAPCLLLFASLHAQDAVIPIHDIQGPSTRSPYEGRTVTTSGIVTARRSTGFYIQAPEAEYDADGNTSEGLLVFTSSAPPAEVVIGALVRLTGQVLEFRSASDTTGQSVTEISRPTAIQVVSTGNALPQAWMLGREHVQAGWGFENLERFEGMRVYFAPNLIVVSPTGGSINERTASSTSSGIFYSVILGTPRPVQNPNWDGSPERLRVDSAAQPGATRLDVAAGQTLDGRLTGPLDFGGNAWTLVPDPGYNSALKLPAAAPLLMPGASEFSVASLNCQRFFDDVDDPGISDAVLSAEAFQRRVAKLALFAVNILRVPDVLAVQEVENLATLENIAARINQQSVSAGLPDPQYRAYLEEGNDPGGIDSGFLVRTARLGVRRVTQYGKDVTYIRPDGRSELLNDRPPLVLRAVFDNQFPITLVVNHFRSMTDIDDPVSGPRIRLKRKLQAEYLRDLLLQLQRETPSESIASVGDYNSYPFEKDTIGVVESAGYINLAPWLPEDQNCSYIFDGTAATFDQVLVNAPLRRLVSRIQYTRAGASFPESLRGDFSRPERLTDHEAVLASFLFEPRPFTAAGVTSNFTFLGGQAVPGTWAAVFGSNLPSGQDAFQVDGKPVSSIYASPSQHVFALPADSGTTARLSLGAWSVDLATTTYQPAIVNVSQSGDRLFFTATGIAGGYALGGLSFGPHFVPLPVFTPVEPRNGFWRGEAQLPSYLPRGVTLPLVLSIFDRSSPRNVTLRLE